MSILHLESTLDLLEDSKTLLSLHRSTCLFYEEIMKGSYICYNVIVNCRIIFEPLTIGATHKKINVNVIPQLWMEYFCSAPSN